MNRITSFRWLLALALTLGMGGALADEAADSEVLATPTVYTIDLKNGGTIKAYELAEFVSRPGEDKVAFLKRVGRFLQPFAFHSSFEACGRIWQSADGTAWAVPVMSLHAHFACSSTTIQPPGADQGKWTMTDETIHVHPFKNTMQANANDHALTGMIEGTTYQIFPRHFSPGDYKAGAGYLVANEHLQYEREEGKVEQDFGPVEAP